VNIMSPVAVKPPGGDPGRGSRPDVSRKATICAASASEIIECDLIGSEPDVNATYRYAQTNTIDVGGAKFACRQLGQDTGVPVIFLNHLGPVLDNWDPRIIDGIAAKHRGVTCDNRGIGASAGSTPDSAAAMARDTVAFARALGFEQVDLLGFSLGGFIAQVSDAVICEDRC